MLYNGQGEYRAVIALDGLQLYIEFSWSSMTLDEENCTVCHGNDVENHAKFGLAKFLKITILLWKNFGQNLYSLKVYKVFHVCYYVGQKPSNEKIPCIIYVIMYGAFLLSRWSPNNILLFCKLHFFQWLNPMKLTS